MTPNALVWVLSTDMPFSKMQVSVSVCPERMHQYCMYLRVKFSEYIHLHLHKAVHNYLKILMQSLSVKKICYTLLECLDIPNF